jgi:hypothetical protein
VFIGICLSSSSSKPVSKSESQSGAFVSEIICTQPDRSSSLNFTLGKENRTKRTEPFDGEEENDESAVPDPVRRAGLERMATGLRANQPGMEVLINPPGHRKVSDMICLVAGPLLECTPDCESKQVILKLTALAWNFTLFDPIKQEEMLAEVAHLFPSPEDMDIFYYLANRKALLFPEEERVICKVETGPALYSGIALRVASAM